ncbi:FRG domain-containing protein [Solirubrobacter phytolaccae]|uniref:FRG domain-containing protein n=1 Tax=Solirubrobacter phytolaccae TaxID=1404360 RepID=A0A9X3NBX7_9ACTN|nr:FRG domain-containing protein [Solirubrobacter phytolaccae]MDA0179937.1 FRG domain-containing protein [Solirubrobacter phytolaccae]
MGAPEETTIKSLGEFTHAVEIAMGDEAPVWYRGVTNAEHPLVPSLFRHPTITQPNELIKLERDLQRRYEERSIPFRDVLAPVGDWGQLFVMQHFGVPTRLLDWSENPFVGLYFALANPVVDPNTKEVVKDAVVWALKPIAWNRHALQDVNFTGGILSIGTEDDDFLKALAPGVNDDHVRATPLALHGIHNSPRIVAQRGAFTIFSKYTTPMDQTFDDKDHPAENLRRFVIPADHVMMMQRALTAIGITDSVIYPDLGGLALELKRYFKFV